MNKEDMLTLARTVFPEEEADTVSKGDKTECIAITVNELEQFYKLAFYQGKNYSIEYLKKDSVRLKEIGYFEDSYYLAQLVDDLETGYNRFED